MLPSAVRPSLSPCQDFALCPAPLATDSHGLTCRRVASRCSFHLLGPPTINLKSSTQERFPLRRGCHSVARSNVRFPHAGSRIMHTSLSSFTITARKFGPASRFRNGAILQMTSTSFHLFRAHHRLPPRGLKNPVRTAATSHGRTAAEVNG